MHCRQVQCAVPVLRHQMNVRTLSQQLVCHSAMATHRAVNERREQFLQEVATALSAEEREKRKKENTICNTCNGSGYNGRIGTYEFLPISRDIQIALKEKKSDSEIQNIAIENGMLTLASYGKKLIISELTTVNEVLRVCKN